MQRGRGRGREERLKTKNRLEEKWAKMRWLVNYIDENQEQWKIDKEIRQNEKSGEITDQGEKTTTPPQCTEVSEKTKWEEWREKARRKYRKKEEKKEEALGETDPNNVQNTSVAKLSENKTTETENELDTELNMTTTATVETELTRLDDREQDQINIKEFRAKVDEMVLSLEIQPSRILQQRMMRFDLKLEEAVGRMANLGCIEECEEHEEWPVNLSVAENSREIMAPVTVIIVNQNENKNVTRSYDVNREKYVRLGLADTVMELSVAEDSQDSLAPVTRRFCDSLKVLAPMNMKMCGEWPETVIRLSLADDVKKLSDSTESKLYGEWMRTKPGLVLAPEHMTAPINEYQGMSVELSFADNVNVGGVNGNG